MTDFDIFMKHMVQYDSFYFLYKRNCEIYCIYVFTLKIDSFCLFFLIFIKNVFCKCYALISNYIYICTLDPCY